MLLRNTRWSFIPTPGFLSESQSRSSSCLRKLVVFLPTFRKTKSKLRLLRSERCQSSAYESRTSRLCVAFCAILCSSLIGPHGKLCRFSRSRFSLRSISSSAQLRRPLFAGMKPANFLEDCLQASRRTSSLLNLPSCILHDDLSAFLGVPLEFCTFCQTRPI